MPILVDNTALFHAQIQILLNKNEELRQTEQILKEYGQSSSGKGKQRPEVRNSRNFRLYSSHSRQILVDITELRDLVLDKRKEYILCSNTFSLYGAQKLMSNEDRRKFDTDTDIALKQCTKLIKDLEVHITSDRSLRQSDELKHLITVTNMLNVYLKEVLNIVTQLREIHLRKSKQFRRICRLANLVGMYGTRLETIQKEEKAMEEKLERMKTDYKREYILCSNTFSFYGAQELISNEDRRKFDTDATEQAQLLEENKKLFERFNTSNSELQRIETHMEEIQHLQNMFSEKLNQQEQDIDIIHSRTVYTLDNLESANDFIREAIKNQANRRVILIFCLLVLTFTLLFLDWYNP